MDDSWAWPLLIDEFYEVYDKIKTDWFIQIFIKNFNFYKFVLFIILISYLWKFKKNNLL
jgi:hypothetical protein